MSRNRYCNDGFRNMGTCHQGTDAEPAYLHLTLICCSLTIRKLKWQHCHCRTGKCRWKTGTFARNTSVEEKERGTSNKSISFPSSSHVRHSLKGQFIYLAESRTCFLYCTNEDFMLWEAGRELPMLPLYAGHQIIDVQKNST